MQTAPYLMKRNVSESGEPLTGNNMYDGYCAELAKKVAEIVGFQYEIVPVPDGKYGSRNEDGTWNGMVGELVRNVGLSLNKKIQFFTFLMKQKRKFTKKKSNQRYF